MLTNNVAMEDNVGVIFHTIGQTWDSAQDSKILRDLSSRSSWTSTTQAVLVYDTQHSLKKPTVSICWLWPFVVV